ncbi:glycine reductase [Thermoanaerobacteraceae bacterium SP2]|nr:glycine reductase [Thermoanaerobacteraceae bacterium SP2]
MALDRAELFYHLADALEGKRKKIKIGITVSGGEHPPEMLLFAARKAQDLLDGVEVIALGPAETLAKESLKGVPADCLADAHRLMEKMLDDGELDAAVTMHYNFPLGISTVGRVVTPGKGRPMYIATTTGSAAAGRVEAMVKNAIYGIIAARAAGDENPSLGILNLDGARQAERLLKAIKDRGYDINFAESLRADGGCIMRGNDLLAGSCDIMVTDTLTGNLLMKIFSAYTTGGDYEASGWGYGPGIGENASRIILILSRASGAPVMEGAIRYAVEMVRGNLLEKTREEFVKLKALGFDEILKGTAEGAPAGQDSLPGAGKTSAMPWKSGLSVSPPPKKAVTEEISGIDVLQMEEAANTLWKSNIYAETGMGCTGPVILVAGEDLKQAVYILKAEGYL